MAGELVMSLSGARIQAYEADVVARSFTVPLEVEAAYAVGHSLNAFSKLRNRVSHQEQILYVDHAARLGEICGLTECNEPWR
ncbi:hypothetical protein [Corynebacterium mucifaciens]|uniref:Uncharacterized protein n=1 Tax=Corynebacterium mucifaciens TaxID=57171 RepID=A0A7X6RF58_9CORY|nr:hypothetical protein [Corynebacterium mucifaciens]NKY69315.1 hypothetical protein [Corynebacterium mucifaciens]